MSNDFRPELGHRFTFRTDPAPGFDGVVHCEVLAIETERYLEIRWRGGPLDTVVRFTLEPEGAGTRLTLEHAGFKGLRGRIISRILKSGWGKMLDTHLPTVLSAGQN
jgi:uncharacterized protein YndB with AHSA1/START domain